MWQKCENSNLQEKQKIKAQQELPTKNKILLVGLCCIDEINFVKKYPNEDSETRIYKKYSTMGGNVTNSAVVLRQLTPEVQICASLPATNSQLMSLLMAADIDTSLSILRSDPNTEVPLSTCILNETTGSRTVFHYRGNLPEINAVEFEAYVCKAEILSQFKWIHFEGRNFDHLEIMMQKVRKFRDSTTHFNGFSDCHAGFPMISVEFEKIRNYNYFERLIRYADVVFMSKDFAKNKGWDNPVMAIEAIKKIWINQTDSLNLKCLERSQRHFKIICPWGCEGVYGLEVHGSIEDSFLHIPVEKVDVVDSLGAGDCFIGACIWALWNDHSFHQALQIANHVAATKCAQRGLWNLNLKGVEQHKNTNQKFI